LILRISEVERTPMLLVIIAYQKK